MSGLFKGRSSTTTMDAMLTPEQKAAMATLNSIGQNGGDTYTDSLGDFTQTGTQNLSSNKLYELINGGNPAGYDTARTTLTGLANNKFNPDDPSSGYAAYQRQVARAGGVANDALNREAAITGDRYSTSIGRNKADLGAQMNDQLATKLGELYNTAQDRSLNAANALNSLETNQANNIRANLGMGFDASQGGLQNTLNNALAQAKYNEFKRQQDTKLNALNSVLNKNVDFGIMSSTKESPSIFSSIAGQFSPILGSYNTAKYGATNAPNQANMKDMATAFAGGSGGIMSLFKTALMGGL